MNQITHLLGLSEHSLNTIKKSTPRKKEDNAVKSVKMTVGILLVKGQVIPEVQKTNIITNK